MKTTTAAGNYINNHCLVMRTANYLKQSRIEMSLTGLELGKFLNLSQQQISRYETGKSVISIDNLKNYLSALGKSWIDYFEAVVIGDNHSEKENDELDYVIMNKKIKKNIFDSYLI